MRGWMCPKRSGAGNKYEGGRKWYKKETGTGRRGSQDCWASASADNASEPQVSSLLTQALTAVPFFPSGETRCGEAFLSVGLRGDYLALPDCRAGSRVLRLEKRPVPQDLGSKVCELGGAARHPASFTALCSSLALQGGWPRGHVTVSLRVQRDAVTSSRTALVSDSPRFASLHMAVFQGGSWVESCNRASGPAMPSGLPQDSTTLV